MIDGHIHIERGDYTLEWIQQFVNRAVAMGLLVAISNIDEMIEPGVFLFDKEDIRNIVKEYS
ncbi:MAG: hypothetical protein IKN54_10010 [Lachnospiraceae bacterium]|nr:hypothetical protein [Lachnospiraceae bacterium]